MIKLLIHWLLSAVTLLVISHFLHGFVVRGRAGPGGSAGDWPA
jgi:uncharacterized membrane protein YvlD (DUF360 family)